MNSKEQENIDIAFPNDSDGKTMEDYFDFIYSMTLVDKDTLKQKFKETFPEESDWSF